MRGKGSNGGSFPLQLLRVLQVISFGFLIVVRAIDRPVRLRSTAADLIAVTARGRVKELQEKRAVILFDQLVEGLIKFRPIHILL